MRSVAYVKLVDEQDPMVKKAEAKTSRFLWMIETEGRKRSKTGF
jgi:hypothetical protein